MYAVDSKVSFGAEPVFFALLSGTYNRCSTKSNFPKMTFQSEKTGDNVVTDVLQQIILAAQNQFS